MNVGLHKAVRGPHTSNASVGVIDEIGMLAEELSGFEVERSKACPYHFLVKTGLFKREQTTRVHPVAYRLAKVEVAEGSISYEAGEVTIKCIPIYDPVSVPEIPEGATWVSAPRRFSDQSKQESITASVEWSLAPTFACVALGLVPTGAIPESYLVVTKDEDARVRKYLRNYLGMAEEEGRH